MSKLPKVLLLLVLMGTIGSSQVQRPGPAMHAPVLVNPGAAIGSLDELQQYTAGGHILGFRTGEMFVASGDHALKVEFLNSNPASPIGEGGSANSKKGHEVAPPLSRVTYRDLWDGVTLVYENPGSGVVKSTYHIEPAGAGTTDRVDEIRLRYNVPMKVDESGSLVFSFSTGEMLESRPIAWQEIEGKRVPVEATYRLISEQEVGFKVGSYDSRYPLVIDPVLTWNAFLGGSSTDDGTGIALDTNGNLYVTGYSAATWGSPVLPFAGGYDAFVAKLNGSGVLQWNTFLGGSGFDTGEAITVDTNGNIYVAGSSGATWGSPVRPFYGGGDAFAAKLNGSGALQWNTFLGGSSDDLSYAIAVDTSGNVYVAGHGEATWGSPVRPFSGSYDAFAAKLNGSGALQWNTFLGASSDDYGRGIAVDTNGNVYVTGMSSATWGSPILPFAGGSDAYVAKLNGSGVLQWNAFIGSTSNDSGNGITLDTSGNIYVTGLSNATWGSPIRPHDGGVNYDAFVAKLNNSGAVQWNTFLGGSTDDLGLGIAVDTSGNLYVAGYSSGSWGSPIRPYIGGTDAFAAQLNGSGALQWNIFLGTSDTDYGFGIAANSSGNVYVVGTSTGTWGSPIIPFGGNYDAFVAKILTIKVKNDFNADGQDDILWRYYGPGGLNVVWEMGTGSIPAPALGSQANDNGAMNLLRGQGPERIYWSPLEAGGLLPKRPARSYRSAMEAGEKREIAAVYKAPWEVWGKGKGTKVLSSPLEGTAVPQTAPSILTSVPLYPVADTNWEIAGVGDFNGDGKPDILWRNYGTPGWTGTNLVWYMNGTAIGWQELLYTVTDPNWRIVGVGDFNGDGKPDIVWRNYGTAGWTGTNVVWYMNCGAIAGQDVLYSVANPNWKIVGVGDFNGDTKPDILWRDCGTSGMNVIWYMNGAAIAGQDVLYTVADLNWRIEGVGDYNGDGKPDILWRNYGSGGWTGTNLVWYMNGATILGQDLLYPVTDLNWRIVIH